MVADSESIALLVLVVSVQRELNVHEAEISRGEFVVVEFVDIDCEVGLVVFFENVGISEELNAISTSNDDFTGGFFGAHELAILDDDLSGTELEWDDSDCLGLSVVSDLGNGGIADRDSEITGTTGDGDIKGVFRVIVEDILRRVEFDIALDCYAHIIVDLGEGLGNVESGIIAVALGLEDDFTFDGGEEKTTVLVFSKNLDSFRWWEFD